MHVSPQLIRRFLFITALVSVLALALTHNTLAAPQAGGIVTVNYLGDTNSKDGQVSLREAILLVRGGNTGWGVNRTLDNGEINQISGCSFTGSNNAWSISTCSGSLPKAIAFHLANCPCTIALDNPLPVIDEPVTIDGYTNPGASVNTLKKGTNAQIMITLSGLYAGFNVNGLDFKAAGNVVRGLKLYGFDGFGILLENSGNHILGNIIDQNAANGILMTAGGNFIGDGTPAGRNAVIRNGWHGIEAFASASGNNIYDNLIGVGLDGKSNAGNIFSGVSIYSSFNTIAKNQIAFNHDNGILILSGTQNYFDASSIYANGKLGIDLGNNGVTLNDAGDGDTGANGLQNYPVLTSATSATRTVSGKLNSKPNTTFSIVLYKSPSCDASHYGEGKTYLGTGVVHTDGSGVGKFTANVKRFAAGNAITALTSGNEGHSEFSKCITAK